jgi:hypothetical protein
MQSFIHGDSPIYDTKRTVLARDVIKDDFGGKLPSGRPFRPDVRGRRPDVRARPRLPRERGFTRADASCPSARTRKK